MPPAIANRISGRCREVVPSQMADRVALSPAVQAYTTKLFFPGGRFENAGDSGVPNANLSSLGLAVEVSIGYVRPQQRVVRRRQTLWDGRKGR
ncbi:hypothetical protein MRX96_056163 [Rhipicephalus microplus]